MAPISGTSTAEVDAPIDRCWALIEDVAIAPEAAIVTFQLFLGDPAFDRLEAAIKSGQVIGE